VGPLIFVAFFLRNSTTPMTRGHCWCTLLQQWLSISLLPLRTIVAHFFVITLSSESSRSYKLKVTDHNLLTCQYVLGFKQKVLGRIYDTPTPFRSRNYKLYLYSLFISVPNFYSIHPIGLQVKSGLGLLYWGSVTIMFYGVRLLASRPTPVNFGGTMIFCWGLLP
jgi:hypothetical protein